MGQAEGARETGAGSPEPLGNRSNQHHTKSRPSMVLSRPSETGLRNHRIEKRSLSKFLARKSGATERAEAPLHRRAVTQLPWPPCLIIGW